MSTEATTCQDIPANIYAPVNVETGEISHYSALKSIFSSLNTITNKYVPQNQENTTELVDYQLRASALRAITICLLWGKIGHDAIEKSPGIGMPPLKGLVERFIDRNSLIEAREKYKGIVFIGAENLELLYKTGIEETPLLIGDLNVVFNHIESIFRSLREKEPGEAQIQALTITPEAIRNFQNKLNQGRGAKTSLYPETLLKIAYGLEHFFSQKMQGFEKDCYTIKSTINDTFNKARNSRREVLKEPHIA